MSPIQDVSLSIMCILLSYSFAQVMADFFYKYRLNKVLGFTLTCIICIGLYLLVKFGGM